MISQYKPGSIQEFVEGDKDPLEHHFDTHTHCGDWCGVIKGNTMGLQYNNPMGYMSKKKHATAYGQLREITEKYGSAFYLEQSRHPFNTQTNEALNNSQAHLTPKNKVFYSSEAFHSRNAIVIGTHNWGYRKYWQAIYCEAGIECT